MLSRLARRMSLVHRQKEKSYILLAFLAPRCSSRNDSRGIHSAFLVWQPVYGLKLPAARTRNQTPGDGLVLRRLDGRRLDRLHAIDDFCTLKQVGKTAQALATSCASRIARKPYERRPPWHVLNRFLAIHLNVRVKKGNAAAWTSCVSSLVSQVDASRRPKLVRHLWCLVIRGTGECVNISAKSQT